MKGPRKTKLPNFDILRVLVQDRTGAFTVAQPLRHVPESGVIPPYSYVLTGGGLYLPRRQRGQKFHVLRTVADEVVL
jgi:hypothetical protein